MGTHIYKPLQKRSRHTANKVLDALDALLKEKDLGDIGIQELAQRAGASVSSIYARFADKHAMVLALHQRITDNAMGLMTRLEKMERQSLGIRRLVERSLSSYLAFAREHQHIFRAAILSNDAVIYKRVVKQIRFVSEAFFKAALSYDSLQQPGLEQKIDFAARTVAATMQQSWIMNNITPARFKLSDAELVRHLTDMVLAYIQPSKTTRKTR